MDRLGNIHEVYIDNAGVAWFVREDPFTNAPKAYLTVQQWDSFFEPTIDVQEEDDTNEESVEVLTEGQVAWNNFKNQQRARAQARTARLNEDRRVDRQQAVLDENHPVNQRTQLIDPNLNPQPLMSPPTRKRVRAIADLQDTPYETRLMPNAKKVKESPATFAELEQSRNVPPQEEFKEFLAIPGKRPIGVQDLPQGFPGTENRLVYDINPFHRNVGPDNTISSLSEAYASGPESVAAWRHDLAYTAAETAADAQRADEQFLEELQNIPPENRGFLWKLYHDTIAAGAAKLKWIATNNKKLRKEL